MSGSDCRSVAIVGEQLPLGSDCRVAVRQTYQEVLCIMASGMTLVKNQVCHFREETRESRTTLDRRTLKGIDLSDFPNRAKVCTLKKSFILLPDENWPCNRVTRNGHFEPGPILFMAFLETFWPEVDILSHFIQ